MIRLTIFLIWVAGSMLGGGVAVAAQPAAETVRLAFIDPLIGPFANAGESSLRHFRTAIEALNERGVTGVHKGPAGDLKGAPRGISGGAAAYRFEITGFDNKASAQDSLAQLRLAIDQGYRIIIQGQSSAAALALSDAITKHNAREPSRQVLFLNYAALDPDLTNNQCSFWHFRFDANSDMRVEAMAKVLEKAARELALDVNFYTFYAGSLGAVTAIGEAGAGRVKQVTEWHANVPSREIEDYARRYKARWGEDLFFFRVQTLLGMLSDALAKARSAEPAKIAAALEGMRYQTVLGEVEMRASDHQLLQPLSLVCVDAGEVGGAGRGQDGALRRGEHRIGISHRLTRGAVRERAADVLPDAASIRELTPRRIRGAACGGAACARG